ncbi:hypothetical protein MATL_G00177910 [Megalops atlanticus]|uniref:RRM domain-containing protein n=1 Tax=Megalops atlanticus TaxID=7932 RepID=A0A9D3T227_MEGAT|nr:hypothetical protein MATL_G00177910 [Megalops atlanticus]
MASAADGLGSAGAEQASLGVPVVDPGAWATAMSNLGIVPMSLTGQQLVADSVCIPGFDPSLGIIAPINPMMAGIGLVPPPPVPVELPVVKEIIHCKSCTLFPQNPNLPPPSTRERPPGCKTVFVGGLPENASEEIIREVFDQCGDIVAIRKSKKNFCHIRFSEEFMVDKAIYLSGYRMRIGSSTDKKDSGRIHVDYAQARDDLYEWECKQRLLAREERHRRKIQEDRLRPPSPPPIMHYSEHEASLLADRLKDDNKFSEATAVLLTWIDRGEVNRRSANHFYSMIQSANSHVRRLMNEKALHEEEMELAREHFKNALLSILTQFEQITAVLTAATRQKAWDHFSKAQRRNIDMWRKQCEELRNAHSEDIMGIRREEEMEMSEDDSDENPCKKMRLDDSALAGQAYALREENDSLRWQLDAYRNEVELLKQEQGKAYRSDEDQAHEQQQQQQQQQQHFLQQTLQGMQQQLLGLQEELKSKELELERAREQQRNLERELLALKERLLNSLDATELSTTEVSEKVGPSRLAACFAHQEGGREGGKGGAAVGRENSALRGESSKQNCSDEACTQPDASFTGVNGFAMSCHDQEKSAEAVARGPLRSEKEALLLGIISTFLHVHPFGANIEYLWSYIQRLDTKVSAGELERLMVRLPRMFKQEFSGVGATLEKRWKFCGFEGIQSV